MAHDFQDILFSGLSELLDPLAEAATDQDVRRDLFGALGWDVGAETGFPEPLLVTALTTFGGLLQTARNLLASPPKSLTELGTVFKALSSAIDSLQTIRSLAGAPAGFGDAVQQLLNLMLVRRLQTRRERFYWFLRLLSVIRDESTQLLVATADPTVIARYPVTFETLDFGQLLNLLKAPVDTLKTEYLVTNGLVDPNGTADKLFPRIADLLRSMDINVLYGIGPSAQTVDLGTTGNDIAAHALHIQVEPLSSANVGGVLGVQTVLDGTLGVVLRPFGLLTFADVFDQWTIDAGVSVNADGLAISSGAVLFPQGVANGELKAQITLGRIPGRDEADLADGSSFLIGSSQGTRIELGAFKVSLNAELSSATRDFGFTVQTGKSALIIDTGDGDGFLGSVLPSKSRVDFDFAVGWSSLNGLHFSGGASLEIALAVSITIGGLQISNIRLKIDPEATAAAVSTSADLSVQIGPVAASVEDVGVQMTLSFPDGGGSLGPASAAVSFKPPTGVGIAVNAGAVSGGGFISFKDGRYAGALELQIYSVAVKAFGVIDTKLPDGSKGFSFVIVISAEFTPIQLGFGFMLLGVGGMIGINRSIDQEALRKAVKDGGLQNILFPENVVERAPEIIGSLQAILPPVEGKYVFGPLAKLTWLGLIDGEIGIVLELPGPIITILGEVRCNLPDPDDALVALNMGVTGRLDFPKKALSIDAALRDSRVGTFPVHGQMAMRLRWGDQPLFALAVGGFHPAFQAPPDFPKLEQMSADFGDGGNPNIQLSGFFAITSNTLQIGGALTVHASDSGVTLDAELAAKALFVFSPFHFDADISAGVRVAFHGYGLGVHLHATLSGPSPWRLQGEACVSVLWWDACLNVNHTFDNGSPVQVPTIEPWTGRIGSSGNKTVPALAAALGDPLNWTPVPPARAFQAVTLAEPPKTPNGPPTPAPRFDPMGKPQVRQRFMPLENADSKVTHIGSSPSSGPDRFNLTSARIGESSLAFASDVRDFFAPGQYFDITDAQKLSGPSYIHYQAGYTFDPAVTPTPIGSVATKDIEYETVVRDSRQPLDTTPTLPTYAIPAAHLLALVQRSAVERFGLGQAGTERFIGRTLKTLFGHSDLLFVVTNKATLGLTAVVSNPTSQWEAMLGMQAHVASNPESLGRVQVTPQFLTAGSS